ncbi:hypothetical protein BD310DRAFT_931211, partial [Dichomitus squalens]
MWEVLANRMRTSARNLNGLSSVCAPVLPLGAITIGATRSLISYLLPVWADASFAFSFHRSSSTTTRRRMYILSQDEDSGGADEDHRPV